jgi:hypothetical protein
MNSVTNFFNKLSPEDQDLMQSLGLLGGATTVGSMFTDGHAEAIPAALAGLALGGGASLAARYSKMGKNFVNNRAESLLAKDPEAIKRAAEAEELRSAAVANSRRADDLQDQLDAFMPKGKKSPSEVLGRLLGSKDIDPTLVNDARAADKAIMDSLFKRLSSSGSLPDVELMRNAKNLLESSGPVNHRANGDLYRALDAAAGTHKDEILSAVENIQSKNNGLRASRAEIEAKNKQKLLDTYKNVENQTVNAGMVGGAALGGTAGFFDPLD